MSAPAGGPWWALAVLTVIGVVVYVVARRDQRILNAMSALLTEGRHADVLAHQLPMAGGGPGLGPAHRARTSGNKALASPT